MNLNPDDPQEGIYFNVPEPIYRRAKGYSQSQLKECEYSMLHFKEALTTKRKPTAAQIAGTLLHGLVLQKRELFAVVPPNAPNKPTKSQLNAKQPSDATVAAIKWWQDFRCKHPDKEYICQADADLLYAQRDAILKDPDASEMISRASNFEVAAFKLHSTGLMLKGLADCICEDDNQYTVVPDIKTCMVGGASYRQFQKTIADYGYHRQAAFYTDLFGASFFLFICVEKEPPYATACYQADPEMIRIGRRENEEDLLAVAQCEKTGVWPGYPSGIIQISLPEWKKK
jgi:hypothetical protein